MLLVILKEKKLLERFSKKNCKKQIKQFRVEKATIVLLTVGLIKKTRYI